MISVAAALDPWLQKVTIYRQDVTYDLNERPTFNTPTQFVINAVVQPITSKDLKLFPEGEYSEEALRLDQKTTEETLLLGVDDGVNAADKFHYGTWTYKILARRQWSANGYYTYIADKIDLENLNG